MSELASYCGVSPQAVKQWVDVDGTSPRGKRLEKIAEFFKISEVELVYGSNHPTPTNSAHLVVQENISTYGKNESSPALGASIKEVALANKHISHSEAPYYREIEEVIKLMEQTDDRGRVKALLAVEDVLAVHAAVSLQASAATLGLPLDETLLKIIHSYNHATPGGKELIINATIGASKEENNVQHQKAG